LEKDLPIEVTKLNVINEDLNVKEQTKDMSGTNTPSSKNQCFEILTFHSDWRQSERQNTIPDNTRDVDQNWKKSEELKYSTVSQDREKRDHFSIQGRGYSAKQRNMYQDKSNHQEKYNRERESQNWNGDNNGRDRFSEYGRPYIHNG
jgi:hypothetical protein